MNKYKHILLVISLVILTLIISVGCSETPTTKPADKPVIDQQTKQVQPIPEPTPDPTPAPVPQPKLVENMVYKTNSGKKYHSAGCRYLSKSSMAITKSEAIKEGLTPCSKCNP
jgi:outer membrane biosynthesis protein TonB